MKIVKTENIGVRLTLDELAKLDNLVEVIKATGKGYSVSRGAILRQFINVGTYLIKENRIDELVSLIEIEAT